jgi:hypothetical protein
VSWRGWLAFGGIGSAAVFAWLGEWTAAGLVAVAGLAPAFGWVCGELGSLTATEAMLREVPPPEPEPVPRPPAPDHPPWETAPMPAWLAAPVEQPGDSEPGRHRRRRGLREAAVAAVRAAARVPLP